MTKQNQKGISSLIGIIVVIVLGVAVIGGVLAFQSWRVPKEEVKPPAVEAPVAPTSPAPETADWNVYRNEEYGYEIKYPKEWYERKSEEPGWTIFSTYSKEKAEYYGSSVYKELGENYGLIFQNYLKDTSAEEEFLLSKNKIENMVDKYKIDSFITKEIKIDNLNGYKIFFHYQESPIMYKQGIHIVYIFMDKNEKGVFRFEGEFAGEDREIYENYSNNFDRMLSTFRFIPLENPTP